MLLIVPLSLSSTWILIPTLPGGSFFPVCASRDSHQADRGTPSSFSFPHSASLVLGVRGPSSSVCRSNRAPAPNPAGSSSVSPARSDFPFEGFFPPKRSRVT